MKLLHITHQYWPALGGSEKYITHLSEEMARRSHVVDVFTTRSADYHTWGNTLPPCETLSGVSVRRFWSFPRTRLLWRALEFGLEHYWEKRERRYEPFLWAGNGPVSPALYAAVRRQARHYDVIHINQLHYAHAWTAYAAARGQGVPLVLTPHIHPEQRETYDARYMHAVMRGCSVLIAMTPSEKAFLLEAGWNPHVTVTGSGIQLRDYPPVDRFSARAAFGLPSDAFVVLFLGRKTGYKGLDTTLDAIRLLQTAHPNCWLLAVGPETDFSRLLWSDKGDADKLVIRAEVSEEGKRMALAASDLLCMPSTGEAFGLVYLEGWAYGLPVVGASIPAVATLIADEEDGFLVAPGQTAQLAERISRLVRAPQMGRAMGERGRAKLERRFTVERVADAVEGAYARVRRRRREGH